MRLGSRQGLPPNTEVGEASFFPWTHKLDSANQIFYTLDIDSRLSDLKKKKAGDSLEFIKW